jgi:cytochrome o ubiquinol oxidase operon protein cyoD
MARQHEKLQTQTGMRDGAESSGHGSVRSYAIGFVLSIALTLEAFILVLNHSFSHPAVLVLILIMAIVQMLVQLFFFLHLDRAAKAPWNILVLICMGIVISIVVFGSLWIMQNLNYHMMSPAETEKYMQKNEDL